MTGLGRRRLRRRARSAVTLLTVAALAGAAATAIAAAPGPAGGSARTVLLETAPAGTPAAVAAQTAADEVPAERDALCSLRADRIRQLRSGLPDASSPESLRDAVYLLQERVETWHSGAEGLPAANVPVALAAQAEAAWTEALQAYDAGDTRRMRGALAKAEAHLNALDRQLRTTPIPGCGR